MIVDQTDAGGVAKDLADGAAGLGVIGAIFGYLPEIAAGFAILWYIIRMVEWAEARWGKKGKE